MERRRHQRAPLVREAIAYFGNTGAPCRTLDVSTGGIALALPTAQRAGQFVRISWAFASGVWVDADVVIVRVDRRYAEWVHGTSFLNVEAAIARQIEDYVKGYDPAATPGTSGAWRRVGSQSEIPATPASTRAPPSVRSSPPDVRTTPTNRPSVPGMRSATPPVRSATPPPVRFSPPPSRVMTPSVRFTPPPSRIMTPAVRTTPQPSRGATLPVRGTTPPPFRSPSSPVASSRPLTPSRAPDGPRSTGRPSASTMPRMRTPQEAGDFAGTQVPRNKDELRQLYEDALREVDGVTKKPDKR